MWGRLTRRTLGPRGDAPPRSLWALAAVTAVLIAASVALVVLVLR